MKILRSKTFWFIIVLIILFIAGFLFFGRKNNASSIQTGFIIKQDLKETVLSTGQVVSGTALVLSFQSSGIIKKVLINEGDKVLQGQILAVLDQTSAQAVLTSAKGSLAQVKANYDKLLAGSTQESIKISEDSVNMARQDINSAYASAINTLNNTYTTIYNTLNAVIIIKNSYFSSADQEGIKVSNAKDSIESNMQFISGYLDKAKQSTDQKDIDELSSRMILTLNNIYRDLIIIRTQCSQGIYDSKVLSTDKTILDNQKTNINTSLVNVTTLQQNIVSLKLTLQKAESQLSLTMAPPTQAEINSAKAQILSAQGQVSSAQSTLDNLTITAPVSGTITKIDIKAGEQAVIAKEVISLQDISNLHTEAEISEANIASININQVIDYTFDALGPDKHFQGNVLTINPASTVVSGIVNYKITGSLDNIPSIKPGMTVNMTILTAVKNNTLAVPSTSLINKNNKQYIRIIDDSKKKTYHEVLVQTGLQADEGLIEIISGVSEGQEIVTYIKS